MSLNKVVTNFRSEKRIHAQRKCYQRALHKLKRAHSQEMESLKKRKMELENMLRSIEGNNG